MGGRRDTGQGQDSREQLANDRQRLSDDLSQLRKQMQQAEQELASTQRPAATKLRDALGGMESGRPDDARAKKRGLVAPRHRLQFQFHGIARGRHRQTI